MQGGFTPIFINANAEWKAVKELHPRVELQYSPFGEYFTDKAFLFFFTGCGKSNAAAGVQYVIDRFHPKYLINLGTCGGFSGRTKVGNVILVTETLMYDVVEEEGNASETFDSYRSKLDLSGFAIDKLPLDHRGLMISADRDIIPLEVPGLIKKYDAIAADWESASVAHIAKLNKLPCLILRGVSDIISEEHAEMYGDPVFYEQRAGEVMEKLLNILSNAVLFLNTGF